ncbi:M16 peptidase-like protein [Aureococcus anophagefferens]|nr:M16 peptidase-like protein [Aureococcus anophagefferens]
MLDSASVQALRDIKSLFDDGILTEEEYTNMKAEILTGARSPEPAAVHVGVTCDDCGMSPIRGVRFKCTVKCVAVLPDGRVVSGSNDKSLIVWDPTDGHRLRTFTGHSNDARLRRPAAPSPSEAEPRIVNCVAALPDGCIVSGSGDKSLKVWQAA